MDSVKQDWLKEIELIASTAAEQEGCILYDLEMIGSGNGRILRVYIDKETGDEAGVGVQDCSKVSKALNVKLDEDEDIIPGGNYNLEVSTPGLDRPLRKKWHFEKVVGKKVYVKLAQSLGSLGVDEKSIATMKQFEEVLQGVDSEDLVFEIRSFKAKIPISKIEKSKLVFEMKTNSKKK